MLLYQGVESFKIWTGKEPPVNEMWNALKEAFERRG
jgi:shikimate 5-dehydrogenase